MSFISDEQPFHRLQTPSAVDAGLETLTLGLETLARGEEPAFKELAQPPAAEATLRGVPPAAWPPPDDPCWEVVGETPAALADLYNQLAGHLVFPGLAGYAAARSATEIHFAVPRVIAVCRNADDIRSCIRWARARSWPISLRSGGHNGAGFHLCNGLTLDLQNLNMHNVAAGGEEVTLGAGVKWKDVGEILKKTDACLPGGTCGHVAVGGYTQGGGYSVISRSVGLTCDLLVSARVLLADGREITVDQRNHPDLFWAIRGGGGGQFGVVLSMTFKLVRPDAFFGFVLNWPLEDAPRVLAHLEAHHTSDKTSSVPLGYLTALTPLVKESDPNAAEDVPSFSMLGVFQGSEDKAKRYLADVSRIGTARWRWRMTGRFHEINAQIIRILPYTALALNTARKLETTGYVGPSESIDWDSLVKHIATSPHRGNLVAFEPYGGAIASHATDATAFPHRAQKLNMKVNSYWGVQAPHNTPRPRAEAWLHEANALLQRSLNGHVYVNYMREDLNDYRTAYWGDNFARLLRVKQHYDPDLLFQFEHSIRPR